ncbi:MAG TPA: ZIP family metal transporter [Burkholderiales bacterium]
MLLLQIVAATLVGGVLSLIGAALLTFFLRPNMLARMVSFAVGVMLATAFLDVLPGAFAQTQDQTGLFATVLGGLIAFFALEKVALWRHSHTHEPGEAHERAAPLVLIGDGFHNFADGVLIAAAFLTHPALGWTTTIAILAHEIPQEMGDFLVLLNAGYSRAKAYWLNLASSATAIIGGIAGYYVLGAVSWLLPYVLALAASSFIYIAVADLIPGMNRRWDARRALSEMMLVIAGIIFIVGLHELMH